MASRTWIKLHCKNWLEGSLREESIGIRGVWAGLLALAGDGRYGDSGEIKLSNGVGLMDSQVSEILTIKLRLWRQAKRRFLHTDRIKITEKGAILIVNWPKYQSEYCRQKLYRQSTKGAPGGPDKYVKGEYQRLAWR